MFNLVHVEKEKLQEAAQFVYQFLENVNYTETLLEQISIDVDRFRSLVIRRGREAKREEKKRPNKYSKSKIRRIREKVVSVRK